MGSLQRLSDSYLFSSPTASSTPKSDVGLKRKRNRHGEPIEREKCNDPLSTYMKNAKFPNVNFINNELVLGGGGVLPKIIEEDAMESVAQANFDGVNLKSIQKMCSVAVGLRQNTFKPRKRYSNLRSRAQCLEKEYVEEKLKEQERVLWNLELNNGSFSSNPGLESSSVAMTPENSPPHPFSPGDHEDAKTSMQKEEQEFLDKVINSVSCEVVITRLSEEEIDTFFQPPQNRYNRNDPLDQEVHRLYEEKFKQDSPKDSSEYSISSSSEAE